MTMNGGEARDAVATDLAPTMTRTGGRTDGRAERTAVTPSRWTWS